MLEISSKPLVYRKVGFCIYCGARNVKLTKEHIVPFALGGNAILPESSCTDCSTITGKIEQISLRGMLGPIRTKLGLPTRRKKDRPQTLPLGFKGNDGLLRFEEVPIEKFPQIIVGFEMPPPGILSGRASEKSTTLTPILRRREDSQSHGDYNFQIEIQPWAFIRMLAKIAYSFAFANLGASHFKLYKIHILYIVLETADYCSNYIGGVSMRKLEKPALHRIEAHEVIAGGIAYFVVDISLFTLMQFPAYRVVVGSRPQGDA